MHGLDKRRLVEMEWVYNPPHEEPSVFEGKALDSTPATPAPFDLFSPAPPVESADPHPELDEPEFYGDADTPDPKVPPEEAFALFAQRVDFSAAIHSDVPAPKVSRHTKSCARSETRTERLRRVSAEVAALAVESGFEPLHGWTTTTLPDLGELREQLRDIERCAAKGAAASLGVSGLRPGSAAQQDENAPGTTTLRVIHESPEDPTVVLSALQRRVADLETSVGVSHQNSLHDGKAIGPLLDDVRVRLELASDDTLVEKLKEDAREIAEVLQRQVNNERTCESLRLATVLEKMERWESLADTVPLVVQRLRGFKRLQDEAASFATALSAIAKQVDSMTQRCSTNAALVAEVQQNLEQNIKSVHENLNILEQRLNAKVNGS